MTYEERIFEEWINGIYIGIIPPPASYSPEQRTVLLEGFAAGFQIAIFKERDCQ